MFFYSYFTTSPCLFTDDLFIAFIRVALVVMEKKNNINPHHMNQNHIGDCVVPILDYDFHG